LTAGLLASPTGEVRLYGQNTEFCYGKLGRANRNSSALKG